MSPIQLTSTFSGKRFPPLTGRLSPSLAIHLRSAKGCRTLKLFRRYFQTLRIEGCESSTSALPVMAAAIPARHGNGHFPEPAGGLASFPLPNGPVACRAHVVPTSGDVAIASLRSEGRSRNVCRRLRRRFGKNPARSDQQ